MFSLRMGLFSERANCLAGESVFDLARFIWQLDELVWREGIALEVRSRGEPIVGTSSLSLRWKIRAYCCTG